MNILNRCIGVIPMYRPNLGCNSQSHEVVLVHGKRPHADGRAGVRGLRDLLRSKVRVVVERFHLDGCDADGSNALDIQYGLIPVLSVGTNRRGA